MNKTKLSIAAVIPARGGSKGIIKKNLFPILGKPLIEYTINAALQSKHLTRIDLNTDDVGIKQACAPFDINQDYTRPKEFALDTSSTESAILDWLAFLAKQGEQVDIIVLLQPTSPLRTAALIDAAIEHFIEQNCQSLVGVQEMAEHPYKSMHVSQNGSWSFLAKPQETVFRRQDYDKEFFVINGSIYIVRVDWFLRHKKFVVENETALFITPKDEGIDIDDMHDVYLVETVLKHR